MADTIRRITIETVHGQQVKVDYDTLPGPLKRKLFKEVQKYLTPKVRITEPMESFDAGR